MWDLTPDASDTDASFEGSESGLQSYWSNWSNQTVNGVRGPLKTWGYVSMNVTSDAGSSRLVATAAQRCVITPCARTYSTTVRNGSSSSQVRATDFGTTDIIRPSFYIVDAANEKTLLWHGFVHGLDFYIGDRTYWRTYDVLTDFMEVLWALEGSVIRWHNINDMYFSTPFGSG